MRSAFEISPGQLGNGPLLAAWGKGSLAVATGKRQVALLNQDGIEQHSFGIDSPNVKGAAANKQTIAAHTITWSSDGTILAVLPVASDFIYLWDSLSKRAQKASLGAHIPQQEMKVACWSKDHPQLMIGTTKGTVILFDAASRRVLQNLHAIHEQAITCGDFSGSIFCTAGEDKKVVLTYDTGEHMATVSTNQVPRQVQFSPASTNSAAPAAQLSASDGMSLFISNIRALRDAAGSNATVQLDFEGCGEIIHHAWCGPGSVLVVFEPGIVKLVSTLESAMGQQQAQLQLPGPCTSAAFCKSTSKIAVAGTSVVHTVNVGTLLTEVPSERLDVPSGTTVTQVQWSPGGQLLAAAGSNGSLCCAFGSLPNVSAASGEHYACLSTLTEVTVYDLFGTAVASVPLKFTPHFLALSSTTLAAGMNNQVYFYDLEAHSVWNAGDRDASGAAGSGNLASNATLRSYDEGTAEELAVNDSLAAALIGGRLVVHSVLEPGTNALVPYKGQDVSTFDLTENFLVLGTASGLLQHYSVCDGPLAPLNEFRHTRSGKKTAISALWAASNRSHLVFIDGAQKAFLFSAVDDQVLALSGITSSISKVVFHSEDPNIFMTIEQRCWTCFVYCPVTARGPEVQQIHSITPPVSYQPLLLAYGVVVCQLDNGQVSRHNIDAVQLHDPDADDYDAEAHTRQAIKVFHITEAVAAAARARIKSLWQEVANAALHVLDIDSAIAALREAGNASMVLGLERLRCTEDRYLLAGHVLALTEKAYDTAQAMFVRVNAEQTALQMRKDLRHWSHAAELASQCAPNEVTSLQQQHAEALEIKGDISAAHTIFQEALHSAPPSSQALIKSCKAGIARCTVRAGDARGGLQLALASGSKAAIRDCADLLATTGNLGTALEAGELYEAAGDTERAVTLYLEAKAFARAAPLMGSVKNRKLVLGFAKVREEQGQLAEAAVEYERGGDAESAVRLLLQANNVNKAFGISRRSGSSTAAALIVKHCVEQSNWAGAVEFSLLAGDYTSAWQVAQTHGEMDIYASSLGPTAPVEQHAQVAVCFQNVKEHFKAAVQFELAGNQLSAVSQYMAHAKRVSASEGEDATQRALAIIAAAPPDDARRMASMVLSAVDAADRGRYADKFIELNLALGNTGAAITAAAEAAVSEQRRGEYKVAHQKLRAAAFRFRDGTSAPPALMDPLATLHSYILVKAVMQLGNASTAAQLLRRVAGNLSSFDATHAAQILASAALQCSSAGYSASAFDLAGELMHAQHREALKGMAAYKRKIEALVRKAGSKEDPPPVLVACFWCGTRGPEFELNCAACQSLIPFCSASGKRMEASTWRECPSCRFPGRAEELNSYVDQLGKCPMCSIDVTVGDLVVVDDAASKAQQPNMITSQPVENRHLVNG